MECGPVLCVCGAWSSSCLHRAVPARRQHHRLAVKPGLTCTWQVSGRSDLSFETWMALDLEYTRTWSNKGDILLLLKTIPAVLSMRGAW